MKKITLIFCFFASCLPLFFLCHADDCDIDFDFDEIEIPPPDPELLVVATLKNIIQKPLWEERTYIPNGRDPLYLIPQQITHLQAGGFFVSAFFNATNRMKVTFDEVFNTESINLALSGIVEILSNTNNAQEVARITPLLKKMSLQERKAGFLLQCGIVHGPFIFQVHTSFLLAERNFWLSTRNQQQIRQIMARSFPNFDSLDDSGLMTIKLGFGDTRLKVGLNLVNTSHVQVDVGLETIIPTSGRNVHSKKMSLSTDPQELLPVFLDRTQKLILEPRLGNRGHLGFGTFIESKVSFWNDKMNLWNRLSFNHFFTADEDRLLLFKPTIQPKELDCNNLARFLREYIVPSVFRVTALPGSILNAVLGFDFQLGECRLGLGYDYYLQKKERFVDIINGSRDALLLDNAVTPVAEQHKVFFEGVWAKKYETCQFYAGIGGDVTLASTNIGKDWTSYAKIGILF